MFAPSDHTFALCAYGASPYLETCIKSLLDQTVKTNILISTSTPNDEITKLSQRYGIPLYVNEGAPGICHDWNCAMDHCSTPLITIAHQDDVYLPQYAENVLQMMGRAERPLIFFSDYGEIRDGQPCDDNRLLRIKRLLLSPLRIKRFATSKLVRRRVLSCGSAICCPSVTMCVPNLPHPVFVSSMKSNLDWEAWERLSKLEGSFMYCDKILMRHRIHEGSETSALIRDDTRTSEDLAMLEKFWPRPIARLMNRAYAAGQKSNSL
ncbi:glycosyl transferase family 2 [Collinsella sp. An2]|nr:glycosyl transferase family 2 [Collinsella sp. An2]